MIVHTSAVSLIMHCMTIPDQLMTRVPSMNQVTSTIKDGKRNEIVSDPLHLTPTHCHPPSREMRNVLSFFDSYEQNYKLRFLNEVHSCGNLIESFHLSSGGFHSFHFSICNKMGLDFLLNHCPPQCVLIIFGIIMLAE